MFKVGDRVFLKKRICNTVYRVVHVSKEGVIIEHPETEDHIVYQPEQLEPVDSKGKYER